MADISSSSRPPRPLSQYVEEPLPFLDLFPHRFDYLWAPLPLPDQPTLWKTETQHPLSDRMIEQGSYLYGVRFSKKTRYALLDIDRKSAYHPQQDPFAIRRILEALEEVGITQSLALSSSYSGGIHIYLPFAKTQKSGSLALAIAALVEAKGFKVAPGQLEIFPDPKPYIPQGKPQLYNGHRLPLQSGSYLLNEEWEPVYSSRTEFVRRWQFCQSKNDVTDRTIKRVLKQYRRRQYRISTNANKFLNDLNADIEQGWTDHEQTNWLLGRIALREYIFGHILAHSAPFEGDDLVAQIVKVATALPGYEDWCRHQHEIHRRAKEWARSVEQSRYFHYGSQSSTISTIKTVESDDQPTWNEQQAQTAQGKIQRAIAEMISEGSLPNQITARFKALLKYHVSATTLYRYPELWHPDYFQEPAIEPVEIPPVPPELIGSVWAEGNSAQTTTSLLVLEGCNPLKEEDLNPTISSQQKIGCNPQNVHDEHFEDFGIPQGSTAQEAIKSQKQRHLEKQQRRHIERMQWYLDSGDSILMAEAIAWAQANPGILTMPPSTAPDPD